MKSYIRYCGDPGHKIFPSGICSDCGLPSIEKAKEMAMNCYIVDDSGFEAGWMAGFEAGEENMFNKATATLQKRHPIIFTAREALHEWRIKQEEAKRAAARN